MIPAALLVGWSACRRRWTHLVGITALVAIFSAAALTALLGAQRTSTTLERFREWSHSSDVEHQGGSLLVEQIRDYKLSLPVEIYDQVMGV